MRQIPFCKDVKMLEKYFFFPFITCILIITGCLCSSYTMLCIFAIQISSLEQIIILLEYLLKDGKKLENFNVEYINFCKKCLPCRKQN